MDATNPFGHRLGLVQGSRRGQGLTWQDTNQYVLM